VKSTEELVAYLRGVANTAAPKQGTPQETLHDMA
jgi:hypothetical protein